MIFNRLFVVGAFIVATLTGSGVASASPRHSGERIGIHRSISTHHRRSREHIGSRDPRGGSRRLAWRHSISHRWGQRHAISRSARREAWREGRRTEHRYGRRLSYAASRDAAIRRYVGPKSAYVLTRTPVALSGGAARTQTGRASFYSGGRTASGGRVGAATCAHRTLPFGTRVLVTNLVNARQAILTVNDRGPFVRGRIVDVSTAAASLLGMIHAGTAMVSVQVLGGHG